MPLSVLTSGKVSHPAAQQLSRSDHHITSPFHSVWLCCHLYSFPYHTWCICTSNFILFKVPMCTCAEIPSTVPPHLCANHGCNSADKRTPMILCNHSAVGRKGAHKYKYVLVDALWPFLLFHNALRILPLIMRKARAHKSGMPPFPTSFHPYTILTSRSCVGKQPDLLIKAVRLHSAAFCWSRFGPAVLRVAALCDPCAQITLLASTAMPNNRETHASPFFSFLSFL